MTSTVPSVLSSVRRGKVRAIAVTSKERDTDLPEVPTIAESGISDFEVSSWQGLCTQSAVPQGALARLRTALEAALALPEVRKRIVDAGFQFTPLAADAFGAHVRAERVKWAKLVKEVGIPQQ
jgi:tripartite-type tricarboxylate transporter receptor subunit TctC